MSGPNHKRKIRKNSSIRATLSICLSYVFFHLFINILLDSSINFYEHRNMHDVKFKGIFYSITICLSTICLLMIIISLYLNVSLNPISKKFILVTNLIYIPILTLHFVCNISNIFYQYSEKWNTIMNFSVNLLLALSSLGVNLKDFVSWKQFLNKYSFLFFF